MTEKDDPMKIPQAIALNTEKMIPLNELIGKSLKATPFTYLIRAEVSSVYDNYRPLITYSFKLEVNPAHPQPQIEKIIGIDNEHADAQHYYGEQYAVYTRGYETEDGKLVKAGLEFVTHWDSARDGEGWSNRVRFSGDTRKSSCQLDHNDTVRVKITFEVV